MSLFDPGLLLSGTYHEWLLQGLRMSVQLAGTSLVLALLLGVLIALMRESPVAPLRAAGAGYVEFVRNVPLLVHLLFWYFGAPELLPEAAKRWLYAGNVEFASAVVALTLYTAAYFAEDIRSGLRAVPAGQAQAAQALGFGYFGTMRWVVLPQAVRIAVPQLLSQALNLWKDSSIATVVGVAELMYQAARVEAASFRSAEAFAFATVSYLAVSLALTGLASLYERRTLAEKQ